MDKLIEDMNNLIYHIAREFTSDTDLINELYNQGVLGVYDAYNNYDTNSNTKFSTYAYMYIYGRIYSYVNANRNIRLSKDAIKLYKLIVKTKDYLTQINYKEPSNKEIADYLKMEEEVVNSIILMNQETLSLDYEYDDLNLSSFISFDNSQDTLLVNDLLNALDDEQKKVIMYKYYSGYSQSEIAKLMNMSQSGVSRCEKESIKKMRVRSNI